jgi:hypothetical protein
MSQINIQDTEHKSKPISKVVIITGASSGIGREVTLEMAGPGIALALLALDKDRLEQVAQEVKMLGAEPFPLAVNVTDGKQIEAAVKDIFEKWGRIDTVISNAGSLVYGSVEDCSSEDFEKQISVNYLGAVYLTKLVLPVMLRQGYGNLIYVSSISSRIYLPNNSAYQASKAALNAFVFTLRRELANTGIGVSLVIPGRTKTEIVNHAEVRSINPGEPMLREMPVQRVANLILSCEKHPQREVIRPLVLKFLLLLYNIFPDIVEKWVPWFQAKWRKIRIAKNTIFQGY